MSSTLNRLCAGFLSVALGMSVACGSDSVPTTPTATVVVATPAPVSPPAPGIAVPAVTLLSVTVAPRVMIGGTMTTGTVLLDGPAPAGGAVITIASSTADARPPASVTVPANASTASFSLGTAGVSGASDVLITASYGGQNRSMQIRLLGVSTGGGDGFEFGDGDGFAGGGSIVPPGPGGIIPPGPAAGFNLGSNLSPFVLLGGAAVTCTTSTVTGDIGTSPGTAITGFPGSGCVNVGSIRTTADSAVAQGELVAAYGNLSLPCLPIAGLLDGVTLAPGVYCVDAASSNLTATLRLSGSGVYVLRFATTFITSAGALVLLENGATCGAIAYQVGTSATLEGVIVGNVVALTAITMNPGATMTGRLLARNAAVTLTTNTITNAGCN